MTRPRDIADSINRINSSAADATAMTIDANENVGIGTTSPASPLHVKVGTDENFRMSSDSGVRFQAMNDASSVINTMKIGGDPLIFLGTGGTERMRIDSSGRLLVGKTTNAIGTAGHTLQADGFFSATRSAAYVAGFNRLSNDGEIVQFFKDGSAVGSIKCRSSGGNLQIDTGQSGIDFGGDGYLPLRNGSFVDNNLDIGSSTYRYKDLYLGQSITIKRAQSAQVGTFGRNTDASQRTLFEFRSESQNATVGTIKVTNSTTHYLSGSDYRLKENITNITDGITRLKLLNPKRFNFISMPDNTVDGFIAHEASSVVPEAVSGEKDAMMDEEYVATPATGEIYTPSQEATFDEDGNELTAATNEVVHSTDVEKPDTLEEGRRWRETTEAVMATRSVPDYQAIDQAKLVPLLTAALQEAVAKIETLEAKVTALENVE